MEEWRSIFYRSCRHLLWLGLALLIVGSISMVYWKNPAHFFANYRRDFSFVRELQVSPTGFQPLGQRRYKFCGHMERIDLPPEIKKIWIQTGYAGSIELPEGWFIERSAGGRFIFIQEVAALCPKCAARRHLGEHEGWVAVFYGPAGSYGPLERVTPLKLEWLPESWRNRILSGRAEFADEAEMLQALDSLDEFRR
ncbi:MAG: hypothetical protein PWP65_2081 [Clostridia bacterium]|nr:hypothetical protein [Clostridia bacterium]